MERSKQIMDALEALLREQGFDVQPDGRLDEHPGVNMLILSLIHILHRAAQPPRGRPRAAAVPPARDERPVSGRACRTAG